MLGLTLRLTALLAVLCLSPLCGKDVEMKLRWPDLPKTLEGQKVRVIQNDQHELAGILTAIEANDLVIETRAGKSTVLREAVAKIETRKKLVRTRNRIIGTAIGGGVGAVVLGTVATYAHNEGGVNSDTLVGAAAGVAAGTTILGFLAGRSADTDRTIIQIVP